MLKVELHTHTDDDPIDHISHSAVELIDRAVALGYQALAITLHERQLDIRSLAPYAAERGLVLIPGIERTIEGRHVLLLNFRSGAEDVTTFAALAKLKSRDAGIVVAPHPFFPAPNCLWGKLDRHAQLFDAVEWNAMFTRSVNFNRRAARWAADNGKPLVGNCDVHRLEQLGSTWSLVDAEPDAGAICDAIAAGRVELRAQPISLARAISILTPMFLHDVKKRLHASPQAASTPVQDRS
jgi:predicted metal-dependent phosphoesterase TrpH